MTEPKVTLGQPEVRRLGDLAPYQQGVALELNPGETAGLLSGVEHADHLDAWEVTRLSQDLVQVTKHHVWDR
jgi:hypothetical protein